MVKINIAIILLFLILGANCLQLHRQLERTGTISRVYDRFKFGMVEYTADDGKTYSQKF
jgi:hypothetical protein